MNLASGQDSEEDFSKYNGDGTTLRKAQLRLLDMLIVFDEVCRKYNIQYFISGGTCLGAVRHGGFIPWDDDIDIDVWHTDYQRLKKILPKELPNNFIMQMPETDCGFYRLYMRIVDKDSKVTYPDNTQRDRMINQGLWIDILPLNKTFSYSLKYYFDRIYGTPFKLIRVKGTSVPLRILSYFLYPLSLLMKPVVELLNQLSPGEKITHSLGTKMTPRLLFSECFPPKPIAFEGRWFSGPAKPYDYLRSLYGENYMSIPEKDKRVVHAQLIELYKI